MNKTETLNCFESTYAVLTDMKLSISIKNSFQIWGSNWQFSFPDKFQLEFSDVICLFKVYKLFHLSHTVFPISRNSEGEVTGPGWETGGGQEPEEETGKGASNWLSFIIKCHTANLASTTYLPSLAMSSVINWPYHFRLGSSDGSRTCLSARAYLGSFRVVLKPLQFTPVITLQ